MIKSVYRIRTFIPFSKLQCSTFSSIRSKVLDDNFVRFQLINVLHADRDLFIKSDRYQHVTPDIVSDTLNAAVNLAEKEYLPHSRKNDLCEPKWNPATGVDIIEDVGDAIAAYKGAGFFSAHADFEFGGMQLPSCVTSLLALPFTAANPGTTAYSFLTIAAGNMLRAVGTKEQLNKYLLPMLEGRYFGTMNLSETQAGSSLGDITTKAELRSDGTYSIRGSKMWISAGEHELSENIVHMVLAKVVHPSGGAQAGVKGISLFIVPKFRVNDDGTLGQKNGVSLAGLNHKMGYRGTTNCVMSYGEGEEECIGELLGGVGQGLATMFHMMNEARIAIGFGACGLGYAGYVRSLEYALERHQGRPASSKNPSSPQVPIIQHADVRRMLIAQKAYVEGALSLCMFGAFLVDQLNDPTLFSGENDREDATLLLDTLTPIIKSWPSEWCLEANKWAIQIFGGYGYTRDYDVEQIYRDNRLNMIHEGTNGIQSLDLLGRKVMAKEGRGIAVLLNAMRKSINHAKGVADTCSNTASSNLREHAVALEEAVDRLERTTSTLASAALKGNVELMLCNSHEYLNMTGHTAIAWRWLETEVAATLKTSNSKVEDGLPMDFYVGQRMASRYFFTHELPKTIHQARLLSSLDDLNLVLKNEYF